MDKIKLLVIIIMGIFVSFFGNGYQAKADAPDFDYPQQVSADAQKDLKAALKNGDGQMVVDALVRYSIAKSSITDESIDTIIPQIEQIRLKETRADYRALLSYFEAVVLKSYSSSHWRNDHDNAMDEAEPKDFSEWSNEQFNRRVDQLLLEAVGNPDALMQCPITGYKRIIDSSDKLGAIYCPNLLTFLAKCCGELTEDPVLKAQMRELAVKGATVSEEATIFALTEKIEHDSSDDDSDWLKLYQAHKSNEHCGLPLTKIGARSENYAHLQEYVRNYPKGLYAYDAKSLIANIEEKRATVNYPEVVHSNDKIKASGWAYNVNILTLTLFQVPDKVYDKYEDSRDYPDVSLLKAVATKQVTIDGKVPFSKSYETYFDPVDYGRYIILASYEAEGAMHGVVKTSLRDCFLVTDLMSYSTSAEKADDNSSLNPDYRIIVVDSRSGAPVAGVTVEEDAKRPSYSGVTDKDGVYVLPSKKLLNNRASYKLTHGNDRYTSGGSVSPIDSDMDHEANSADVFTDLSIYRPGETVQFAAVVYNTSLAGRTVVRQQKVKALLRDANWKGIDTLKLTTDDFGRVEGSFVIPTDRLNGTFSLEILENRLNGRRLDLHYINVSEYKAPTFIVSLDDTRSSFTRNQPVRIEGKVETYSGLPLADNEVQLRLARNEWSWNWRWFGGRNNGTTVVDTIVKTDAEGKFLLEIPAEKFEENTSTDSYFCCRYNYSVNAMVTNVAGESQEANCSFLIGGRRGIDFTESEMTISNTNPVKLPLKFNSTDPDEKSVKCHYQLFAEGDDNTPVISGTLDTADPTIDLTSLKSGKYKIRANILTENENSDSRDYMYIILYRLTDKEPIVKDVPLWMPADTRRVDDKNVAHLPIGVSVDNAYIYYIAYSCDKVVAQGWLNKKRGYHDLALQIPQKPEECIKVEIASVYDGKVYRENAVMLSKVRKAMNIKVESFRDKLVPGEREKWVFRLLDVDNKPHHGAMLLEMMDKAIDDIAGNHWSFNVPFVTRDRASLNTPWRISSNSTSYTHRVRVDGKSADYSWPEMNFYDENFFGGGYGYIGAGRGMVYEEAMMMDLASPIGDRMVKSSRALNATADAEMSFFDDGADDAGAGPAVDEEALAGVTMRESDVKVALWKPMLRSDADGTVTVEFDAPQYNTTWVMQAIAYTADLYTGKATRNVITQKPIMVKSSVPRFLRQADKASLAATLQNATDGQQKVDAVIELFNPRTDEVIARKTFNETLDAMATKAIAIDFEVPDTLAFVGFRVKAANKTFGDGEQVMLPVLQSISPVIETKPFYINAATPHFATTLPEFQLDARVTLEYCDNPVWYCATALPTIYSDNKDVVTSLAHSLYAVAVARGIAVDNPEIKDAVAHWRENNDTDSTLVSMLERNGDLKIGTLLASPWLREADRQTLRMSRLNELMDDGYTTSEINRIVKRMKEIQLADGGWPWFRYPGCISSLYTTHTVLEILGEIKHLGYLPKVDGLDEMIARALRYYDAEQLRLFKEQQKFDKGNYSGFADYVYVRTLFPEQAMGKENKDMMKKCVGAMKKDWKGTSMSNKAFYAMALNRADEPKTAKSIVESLRQFAMVKPELGMYWDNLNCGWDYYDDKVAVTAVILQAMNEVDPRTNELDQIRKWMLLMKQSNDWGSSSLAADAVYSLLSTGSKWLQRNAEPDIRLAGETLTIDRRDAYLGYFRREIPAASGATLEINRSGASPAWGAVYSQFRAPMTSIEAVAIDDISIRKELHIYASDGSLKPAGAEFAVGDKVQVRVVIKNNKDLDFVTVKDERGACFEPKDKTSGYRYADGDYYYLETKDSESNIFFTSLRKGTHVISYDTYITAPGSYSVGIATVQCQYAPQITAHSAGTLVTVK